MIFAIFRKELMTTLLRVEFPLALILVTGLAIVLADSGFREQRALERRERLNTEARSRMLDEAENGWEAEISAAPVRPTPPLRPVAQGDERVQADAAEARDEDYVFITGLGVNPLPDILPVADVSFVVGVVLGLLVILLGHDTVSGEHERGTLRLVFTFPVSRARFLMGKWLGGLAAVLLILSCVACAVAFAASLRMPARLTRDDLLAAAALAGLAFLYLALLYTLALLVSTAFRRSATSLVTLTLLWAVAVLVLPNTTPVLAERLVEAPTRLEASARIEAEKAQGMRGYMEARRKVMEKYRDQPEAMWQKLRDMRDELEKRNARAEREVLAECRPRWEALNRTSERLALASPFAAFTLAASRLCQTDPSSRRRLNEGLASYRKSVEKHLEDFGGGGPHGGRRDFEKSYRGSGMPAFEPASEALEERLKAIVPQLTVLAAGTVLLFLAALVVFLLREIA